MNIEADISNDLAARTNPSPLRTDLILDDAGLRLIFQRTARLAARLLSSPLAVVCLERDGHCQILGATGVPDPCPENVLAFIDELCDGAHGQAPFMLGSATPYAAANALGISACACVPMMDRSGQRLAFVCVLDRELRAWGREDLQTLQDLCTCVVAEIELHRVHSGNAEGARPLEARDKELQASELRFALVFHAHPLPMTIHDHPSGRYLDVNEAWLAQTGFKREEVIGKTSTDLNVYADPSVRATVFQLLADQGYVRGLESDMRMKSGEIRRFLLTSQKVIIDGEVRLLSGIQDITESRRIDAQLRQSEERFRMIAEIANEGVWSIDHEGRTQYVNARMAQLLNCEREQLLQRSPADFMFPEDRAAGRAHFARNLSGLSEQYDFRFRRGDGSEMLVLAGSSPLKDAQGKIVGALALFADMTERRRAIEALRASEEQLRLIAHALPVYILHCDTEFRYKFVNTAYAARLGVAPDALIGKRIRDVVGEEAWHVAEDKLNKVLGGEFVQFEARIPYSGTGTRFMRSVNVPERDDDGAVRGLIGVLLDITDQKKIEEERAQLLHQSLEQAAQLRAADRRKDEFLAMLAHELRNPLAPIYTAAQLLPKLVREEPQARQAVEIIQRQVKHMTRLIEDLLDISRITLGKITLRKEEVEVAQIVRAGIELTRPLINERQHDVTITIPAEQLVIVGDPARLAQVVSNLLNNAAKYTEEHGSIALSVERQAEQVVIKVSDNGIGIGPELLPHVFELFTQAERTLDRSQGGLGIGLALVKRLVTMHGGSVEAYSHGLGAGTQITVRLPLLMDRTLEDGAASVMASPASPRRILVVDDNVDAADSLAMLLRAEGHQLSVAYDAATALELARQHLPDVFLLDIGLPGTDGYTLSLQLRMLTGLREAKLIAITGYGQAEDRERGKAAGFDHHLVKPIDMKVLRALLAEN